MGAVYLQDLADVGAVGAVGSDSAAFDIITFAVPTGVTSAGPDAI